jgi:hypothetical protein
VAVENSLVPSRLVMAPSGQWMMVFQNDFAVRAARIDLR